MDCLINLDLYGTRVAFNVLGKSTIKSMVGLILTLLLALVTGLAIASFGRDFFNKTNPIISFFDEIPDKYARPYRLNYTQLQFPFRIYDFIHGETLREFD